jgi:nucleoside 2-deoxyribosyltransferase
MEQPVIESFLPDSMDREATYYISGPMTGYPNYNYEYFGTVKGILAGLGLTIESPHENSWPSGWEHMAPEVLWKHMMELCYAQMKRCEGIILLRGWAASRGARLELDFMVKQEKPVYYFDDEDTKVICMNRKQEI